MTTLVETVRVHEGKAPLWPLHRARLEASAAALGLALPVVQPPQGGDDRVIRYAITAGAVTITERDVGSTEPIRLITSPAPHRGYPHKIDDRGWLAAARHGVLPVGGDDALLLDAAGRVVESTIWAIGWWDGERLCFPPLTLGGLPSVGRLRLDEVARGGIHDVTMYREGLGWRALVACNAARGIVPVGTLDGEDVPGNQRTAALAARFWRRSAA
ncbi:MAG: aminotransferase class IV [Gemmatimonadales bacterium]